MTQERRSIPRNRLRVVHLHQERGEPVRRVSELVFVEGKPQAVLGWKEERGARQPRKLIALDTSRLRPPRRAKNLFRYDGITAGDA
jgi:hypothetical protein